MKYQKAKDIEFSSRMLGAVYLSVLFGALIKALYAFVFMPKGFVPGNPEIALLMCAIAVVVAMVETFVIIPFFIGKRIKAVCGRIVHSATQDDYTPQERTVLLEDINRLPVRISFAVTLINIITVLLFFTGYVLILDIPLINKIFTFVAFICTPFVTLIVVLDTMTSACSKAAKIVTEKPLDLEAVNKSRYFGKNTYISLIIHMAVPFVFMMVCVVLLGFFQMVVGSLNFFQAATVFGLHFVVLLLLTYHYKSQTITEINHVCDYLEELLENPDKAPQLPYDLDYNLSYTIFLINQVIGDLLETSALAEKTASKILEYTHELGETVEAAGFCVSSEGEAIQSSVNGINKINDLQTRLDGEFSEVSLNTKNTLNNINSGSAILGGNVEKISLITSANIETISGIKELSEQIEKIWSVIGTIDSITEKTRTIAFNAEIETSGMGDSGENFHIVANEIRRLADSITDSTLAIRKKITAIQHASDNLIITSEGGTEKIREESELFSRLEEKFEELKLSGQVTEESADHIRSYLMNQTTVYKELEQQIQELNDNFMGLNNSTDEMLTARSLILDALKGEENEFI